MTSLNTRQFKSMGFDPELVEKAIAYYGRSNSESILLFLLGQDNFEGTNKHFMLPTYNALERRRIPGIPVGLQNIGNTCYFNSLLQSYYMIPYFYKFIMDTQSEQRVISCFQDLFGKLTGGATSFVNPVPLFLELNPLQGSASFEQKDIGEFNMKIIMKLEEAINPRWDSSSEMDSNGTLFTLFYGKMKRYIQYQDEKNEIVALKNKEVFGQILLDISEDNEFYSAWDAAFNTSVENFLTPSGHSSTAHISFLMISVPQILIFQLNRVIYNLKKKTLEKLRDKFRFPDTINPSRFLYENRKASQEANHQLLLLKLEIKQKEKELDELRKNAGLGHLPDILRQSREFVEQQLNSHSPISLQLDTDKANSAVAFLLELEQTLTAKINEITHEVEALKSREQSLFDAQERSQEEYSLHSILIHDGLASGGHYYCFIYDSEESVWRKYDDIEVTEVTKAEVFRDSIGGYREKAAYTLIYVNSSLLTPETDLGLRKFSVGYNANTFYATVIPPAVKSRLEDLNSIENAELSNLMLKQLEDKIVKIYVERQKTLENLSQGYLKLKLPSELAHLTSLMNLGIYLYRTQMKDLSCWVTLNTTIQELHPEGQSLFTLSPDDPLMKLLFPYIGEPNFPSHLKLSMSLERVLQSSQTAYKLRLDLLFIQNHALTLILASEHIRVFQVFTYINETIIDREILRSFSTLTIFYNFVFSVLPVIAAKIRERSFPLAMKLISYTTFIMVSHLEPTDPSYITFETVLRQLISVLPTCPVASSLMEALQNRDIIPPTDITEYDASFITLLQYIESLNPSTWIEPLNIKNLLLQYSQNYLRYQQFLKKWISKRDYIRSNKSAPTLSQWLRFEDLPLK